MAAEVLADGWNAGLITPAYELQSPALRVILREQAQFERQRRR